MHDERSGYEYTDITIEIARIIRILIKNIDKDTREHQHHRTTKDDQAISLKSIIYHNDNNDNKDAYRGRPQSLESAFHEDPPSNEKSMTTHKIPRTWIGSGSIGEQKNREELKIVSF